MWSAFIELFQSLRAHSYTALRTNNIEKFILDSKHSSHPILKFSAYVMSFQANLVSLMKITTVKLFQNYKMCVHGYKHIALIY